MNGFAHVEFASTEEASRAVRQGALYGLRYRERLLDIDLAPWVFYIGSAYRVVYISGRPPLDGRHWLLRWTYDIPNIGEATVCTSLLPFPPTLRLTLCHTMNNSAAIPRTKRTGPRTAFIYTV